MRATRAPSGANLLRWAGLVELTSLFEAKSPMSGGRWMAAVLACGGGALLSHASAVALSDLLPTSAALIDVTVPARCGRARRRGIRLHRSSTLHPDDAAVIDGIPVTALPRTLLDFAAVASPARLAHAVERADQRELLDMPALEAVLRRCGNHTGRKRLDAALADHRPSTAFFRSDLEREFHRACRAAGLPPPEMNTWVGEHEVDACWPDYGLAVELDSRTWHERRAAFERDRHRDRALTLRGLRPIRFTGSDMRDTDAVIGTVTRLLIAGGYRSG